MDEDKTFDLFHILSLPFIGTYAYLRKCFYHIERKSINQPFILSIYKIELKLHNIYCNKTSDYIISLSFTFM